jgi:hypothetical protein
MNTERPIIWLSAIRVFGQRQVPVRSGQNEIYHSGKVVAPVRFLLQRGFQSPYRHSPFDARYLQGD